MKTKKCKYYQNKIYLYRAGELSERERDRLKRHLVSCQECAEIKKNVEDLGSNMEQLRTDLPVPGNPVALTNNIMHAVTSYKKLKDYKEYDTSNNMLKLALTPRIRFALLTAIVFVVSLFFIQESLFMGRIAKLEKKISQSTAASIYANEKVKYSTLETKLLLLERPLLFSQNYLLSPKDNNNLIIVDEKILNALMVNYKHVKIQNELLLELIKNKNPDLYNITIKDGLDQAEIKKLVENKKEILRIINEL